MSTEIKFGTDGWRGIIGDDFTGPNVRLVAQAVLNYFGKTNLSPSKTVVIGYDCRAQSEYFAMESASVAALNGYNAILSKQPCSSPAVSFLVKKLSACGGFMITASHNPPNFNGFKIKAPYGGSASPEIIREIENCLYSLVNGTASVYSTSSEPGKIELLDFRPAYFTQLRSLIDLEKIRTAGFKILIDSMHGSGAGYIRAILENAGVKDIVEIRAERDISFGGVNPEPILQNMDATIEATKKYGADVALLTDGDADRVGAADCHGNYVDSHRIFSILLKHLSDYRKWTGDVVKTISTTQLIDKIAARYDRTVHETPIGFKYICDLMLSEDVMIGGEESGGIGVKNHIPERDGVLTSLLLLEAMAVRGKRLDQLVDEIMAEYGLHEFGRIDLHPDANNMSSIKDRLIEFEAASFDGRDISEISKRDGTKMVFADRSWLLLRASGTEPVVRIYAEAGSREAVNALLSGGESFIKG